MGSGRVQEGADPPDAGKTPLHEIFEDPISKILTLEVPQGRVPDKLCFFSFCFFPPERALFDVSDDDWSVSGGIRFSF